MKLSGRLPCPVCGHLMYKFENPLRWVCISVKAHDKALADLQRKTRD